MSTHSISLTVDNYTYHLNVKSNQTLLNVLREELQILGTKYGCGTGECGACTVLLHNNGGPRKPILSCLTLAVLMDGKELTTIAGLEQDDQLHPVQQSFLDETAVQCGFCTPGMILKSVSLLEHNPSPSENEIRNYLEGNICRCTGYSKVIQAIQSASK